MRTRPGFSGRDADPPVANPPLHGRMLPRSGEASGGVYRRVLVDVENEEGCGCHQGDHRLYTRAPSSLCILAPYHTLPPPPALP
jgi:hypothetical protein